MTFAELLQRFQGVRALVVGDLMLDEYVFGRATRISQEAPVMVVRQSGHRAVPGGAANVAKNLVALGASTSVVGVVGSDEAGRLLEDALHRAGLDTPGLIVDDARPTTRKTRVLADGAHQVLRIDHEDHTAISASVEARLLEAIGHALSSVDVVLLSDYQKGTLTAEGVRKMIAAAEKAGVPVVANAKPGSVGRYRGAALVSLNQFETADALKWPELAEMNERPEGQSDPILAQRAATCLRDEVGIDHVLVTLRGDGMVTEDLRIAPVRVEVSDGAGAGDTTIATVALGLATAGYRQETFDLAAHTAAVVVQKVGVAVPSAEDLAAISRR